MYIRRLTIRNIRSISEFELSLKEEECPGWHVLLGENGSGKSTLVRALATVLMGAANAHASRQDWSNWLREGEQKGSAEVTSTQVTMVDGQGARVAIEEMSDGYRSILSMTLELLRLMSHISSTRLTPGERDGTIDLPGVVAIDEVDAHLHPQWQQRIGEWFVRRFPETQFFVTTHSPIICRAATSVWKLPPPGSSETFRRATVPEYDRLVDGNILDAYSTNLFGDDITRSRQSEKKVERLAELSQKQLHEELTPEEEEEVRSLRSAMPSSPTGTTRG